MSLRTNRADVIATISDRLSRRRSVLADNAIRDAERGAAVSAQGLLNWAVRRKRIESERDDWARMVVECQGNIKLISERMGWCKMSAEKAIWDLGLWPALVKAAEGTRWAFDRRGRALRRARLTPKT